MIKLVENVFQIDVPFEGRIVSVYLLLANRILLIDSGVRESPEKIIFPELRRNGIDPESLWAVINTHAHADHCGGNYQLKQKSPNLHIMSLEYEKTDVENPMNAVHALFEPYRDILGDEVTDGGIRWNAEHLGSITSVDKALHDGQIIDLGDDWKPRIYHTPGHTMGHLSMYDHKNRTAFIGDAILWKGVEYIEDPATFPPYLDVEAYINTIRMVKSWPLDYLATSHYSTLRGEEIKTFLNESENFVLEVDKIVKEVINQEASGMDITNVTKTVLDIIGGSYNFDICSVSAIDAHIRWAMKE